MPSLVYRFFRFYFKHYFKKPEVFGVENYDSTVPAVFLCNHEKFYGPIIATTRFPIQKRTWANSMTVERDSCRKYVAESFYMGERGKGERISGILGYFLGTLVSHVISNDNPIVAYWDKQRSRISIRSGVEVIKNGKNQLIFARREEFTEGKLSFMQGYLFMSKLAAKKHGISAKLYPVALNKANSTISIGKPVQLDITKNYNEECKRINSYITSSISLGRKSPKLMATKSPQKLHICP